MKLVSPGAHPVRTLGPAAPAMRRLRPCAWVMEDYPGVGGLAARVADSRGDVWHVASATGTLDLTPIWDRLAAGYIRCCVRYVPPGGASGAPGVAGSGAPALVTFLRGRTLEECAWPPSRMTWREACQRHYAFAHGVTHPEAYDASRPLWYWHARYWPDSGKIDQAAYPGLHYPFHIWSHLAHARLYPETAERVRSVIRGMVDVIEQTLTPWEWAWSSYPVSTISRGQRGGATESGEVLQPLKAALLACSLLDYAEELGGDSRVPGLAHGIAQQLALHQREDGSLPFRVDARSGDAVAASSSCGVFAADLWDRLARAGTSSYSGNRDRMERWLMNGPVADFSWTGNYEDVPTAQTDRDSMNFDNFGAIATASYLLRSGEAEGGRLEQALAIERWVEENFVYYEPEGPVAFLGFSGPVVMEQAGFFYPIDFHAGNMARLELALWRATGEERHRRLAVALLNNLTAHLDAAGRPLTFAPDPALGACRDEEIWFGCAAMAWLALAEGAALAERLPALTAGDE